MSFKLKSQHLIILSFATLAACSSANKLAPTGASGGPGSGAKAVVPTSPPLEITPTVKGTNAVLARAVTAIGDNVSPRFSPDGSKILFLSGARPSHRQRQVYELDLTRMTERRVTFHDGDDESPSWASGGLKLTYSSVTDEMKENISLDRLKAVYNASKATGTAPNGIRSLPKPAGGDIYLQRLDGRDVERLTTTPSLDVSPTADPSAKGTRLVFVSDRDKNMRLYLTDGRTARAISQGPDANPAFSADGKWLVFERASTIDGDAKSQLMLTSDFKKAIPLTAPGFRDINPSWGPKGETVVFSSDRGGKVFDLFVIDRAGSCLKRLTQSRINLSMPSMSPDGSKIAFSAKAGSQNQVYIMDNHADQMACLAAPPAAPVAAVVPAPKPVGTPAPTPSPSPSPSPAR